MNGRVLIAGLLGALAMYVWNSAAHMSPLGMVGFNTLPDASLTADMVAKLPPRAALYIFPSADGPDGTYDPALLERQLKTGPQGMLFYHPPGTTSAMSPAQLILEFVSELVQCVIAAFLVSLTVLTTFWRRVGFVVALSVPVWLATNGSYWNWYGYPADMTLAAMTMQLVGYTLAGLVIAWWLGRKPKAA